MRRRDEPLSVEIPSPTDDRPAVARVGMVAALGFIVGIVWPRLAGVHVAPTVPNDSPAATSAAVVAGAPASSSAQPAVRPPPPAASASAAANPAPSESAAVGQGTILRCRDAKGKERTSCGSLLFDPVATPRLEALARCPGAAGATGKLSVGFDVDFKKKAVHVFRGKSTTLARPVGDAIVKCATSAFANVSLDDVPHELPRYTLTYAVTFAAPGQAQPAAAPAADGQGAGTTSSEVPASGVATIAYDVALARSSPRAGAVVGRVLRGVKVKVLGRQNDWYRIQLGAEGQDGWVYRGAIGR